MKRLRQIPPGARDRFTGEEAKMFAQGTCSWEIEYGTGLGVIRCGGRVVDSESTAVRPETLFCEEHADDWREQYS